jgi:hypothetical protein
MDWIDGSHSVFDVSTRLLVSGVGLFGFLAVVLLGLFRFVYRDKTSNAGRFLSPILFLVFLGMPIVAYARFSFRCNSDLEFAMGEFSIGQVEKDVYWMGETDLGTVIPLFHFDADDQKFKSFAQTFEGRFPNFSNTLISRQSADKEANCQSKKPHVDLVVSMQYPQDGKPSGFSPPIPATPFASSWKLGFARVGPELHSLTTAVEYPNPVH